MDFDSPAMGIVLPRLPKGELTFADVNRLESELIAYYYKESYHALPAAYSCEETEIYFTDPKLIEIVKKGQKGAKEKDFFQDVKNWAQIRRIIIDWDNTPDESDTGTGTYASQAENFLNNVAISISFPKTIRGPLDKIVYLQKIAEELEVKLEIRP